MYFVKLQTVSEGRGLDYRWCHWNLRNPSGRSKPLSGTQILTKIGSSNISWRVKAAGV
jgi:hypothetical protein